MYGLVVYAGKQTKILMNSKSAVIKRSNLERMANKILAFVLLFEMVMCTLGCILNLLWAKGNSGAWYMPFVKSPAASDVFFAWITYFILLNNYVPISLYVSMELAKLGQKILMDHDAEMYHAQSDTPCLARTSTLNEELGQIQYIFSDKTGLSFRIWPHSIQNFRLSQLECIYLSLLSALMMNF
jgi:P-type E1-E2 ATPase